MTKYSLNEQSRELGRGQQGIVFALSEILAVKIFWKHMLGEDAETTDRLLKEFHIARALYKAGLSVPEPAEIYPVTLENVTTRFGPTTGEFSGFVMELIDGLNGEELMDKNIKQYWIANNRYGEEIARATNRGFSPRDVYPKNFMRRNKDGKIFLIDFNRWRFKDLSQL